MKKRLIVCCVLVLAICLSLFAACKKPGYDEATLELLLQDAKSSTAANATVTGDFKLSGTVTRYDEDRDEMLECAIRWTTNAPGVNVSASAEGDGRAYVTIPAKRDADLVIKLVGTLVDAEGNAYTRADGTEFSFEITRTAKETNASMEAYNNFYNKIVKNPQPGVAYKWVVFKEYTAWYFAGKTESSSTTHRYQTTFKYSEAPDVYLEATEGGYYIYFMNGETKTYIDMFVYGTYNSASSGFVTDKTQLKAVYTIHATGAMVANVKDGGKDYSFYLGMRNQYLPSIAGVTDPKILNTDSGSKSYKVVDNPLFFVSEDVSYEQPALTTAQILAKAAALGENEELPGRYSLSGVITRTGESNDTYGTVYIKVNGTETELMCYGLIGAKNLKEGDEIKVTGVIKNYREDSTKDAVIEFSNGCHYEMIKRAPVNVPSNVDKVETPAAETAYKITINQETTVKQIYLLAEMDSYYVKSTEDRFAGIDYYVEAVEGGYKIYRLENETKKYLGVVTNDSHVNVSLNTETVWKIDANGIYTTVGTGDQAKQYYLGTREGYSTVSMYTADTQNLWKAFLGTIQADKLNATITVKEDEHAEITVSKTTAAIGETVTITITLDEGYTISKVTVNGKTLAAVEGVYSFTVEQDTVVAVELIDPSGKGPKGSENNPYTVAEASAAAPASGYSEEMVYVEGYVVTGAQASTGPVLSSGQWLFYLADTATGTGIQIRYANPAEGVTAVGLGDKVLVKGLLTKYNSEAQLSKNKDVTGSEPVVVKIIAGGDGSIEAVAADNPNVTITFTGVEGNKVTGKNGDVVTFTVTVANGYNAATLEVKVNGNIVDPKEGVYSVKLSGAMKITSTVEANGVEQPKGSAANPYTAAEAKTAADALDDKAVSETVLYVRALVVSAPEQKTYGWTFKMADTLTGTQFTIYNATLEEGVKLYVGDTVTMRGYFVGSTQYGGQMTSASANGSFVNPAVVGDITRGDASLEAVAADNPNVTITITGATNNKVTGKNGDVVTFTVSVDDGYDVSTLAVKVNGATVTANEQGVYSATIVGEMKIFATVSANGEEPKGTATNPYTAAEARAEALKLSSTATTTATDKVYVTGIIVSEVTYYSGRPGFYIADSTEEGATQFQIYTTTVDTAVGAVYTGDEIVICGYLKVYVKDGNVTPELDANAAKDYPVVTAVTARGDGSIEYVAADNPNVTITFTGVEGNKVTGKNCSTVTFTVTAADGYDINTLVVKVNGTTVTANNDGSYTGTIGGTTIITTTIELNGLGAKGTQNNPYTVEEAIAEANALAANGFTDEEVYVTGIVVSSLTDVNPTNDYGKQFNIAATIDGTEFIVYGLKFTGDVTTLYIGDTVVLRGYLKNHNGNTPELASRNPGSGYVYPGVFSVTRGQGSIEAVASDHTVTFTTATTGTNGTEVKFTVTPGADYNPSTVEVKVNGNKVTPNEQGVYTVVLSGVMKVAVTATLNNQDPDSVLVIKYQGSTTGNLESASGASVLTYTIDDDAQSSQPTWITVTPTKGGTSNYPGLNKNGYIALYCNKGSSDGCTLTIDLEGKVITKVTISAKTNQSGYGAITVNGENQSITSTSASTFEFELDASTGTLVFKNVSNNPNSATQIWLYSITIEYHDAPAA